MPESDRSALDLARHTLATLAYRGGKAIAGVSDEAGVYKAGPGTRSPVDILAHINDLFDWAIEICEGRHVWRDSTPGSWSAERERFFAGLAALDARLASGEPIGFPLERLFQGPIADALTHVGQIAMLRRMAGSPMRGENYFRAEIVAGRVGATQAPPVRELD